jgi:hypothetical protein
MNTEILFRPHSIAKHSHYLQSFTYFPCLFCKSNSFRFTIYHILFCEYVFNFIPISVFLGFIHYIVALYLPWHFTLAKCILLLSFFQVSLPYVSDDVMMPPLFQTVLDGFLFSFFSLMCGATVPILQMQNTTWISVQRYKFPRELLKKNLRFVSELKGIQQKGRSSISVSSEKTKYRSFKRFLQLFRSCLKRLQSRGHLRYSLP